jgi:hypothetical protein
MDIHTIDPNIPKHIPSSCTEKLSLRLQPWRRTIVEFCAKQNKTSMTDEIIKAIDLYFIDQAKRNKWELAVKAKNKFIQMNLFLWNEKIIPPVEFPVD